MSYRIHPFWWPGLALLSPALGLLLSKKSRAFRWGVKQAKEENTARISAANHIDLPTVESLELTVVVEAKAVEGFSSDTAVSYLISGDGHRVLFDVGYGPENQVFADNWERLGQSMNDLDSVFLSHLHLDHMGGIYAQRKNRVMVPRELAPDSRIPCYTPDVGTSSFFDLNQITRPILLPAFFATTGPLARMLFFLGYTYEQSLIVKLKEKGLVLVIGCGHPTLEVILSMVRKLTNTPIYAVIGGLHFPISASRAPKAGIQVERIFGTGKNWNDPINDQDLNSTLDVLREAKPKRMLISAHDSCDYALSRMETEIDAEFEVLKAGQKYTFP